ncbi:hypothetical protein PK35_15575 [Tamlana nanhaiensis]|uniref:Deacetylase PdaC domain-containing protein n=1 Tax=Neotamlana nanhaiensis TaxID=1382798 RepID=A0A0D7VWW1_9FLAO|nr:hypothetical protein PK35_15575 [Tamlana nanhaiensis]
MFFFISSFFNCKEESTPIEFNEISINIEHNKLVEINTIKAIGDSKIALKINNQLNAALINALHIGNTETPKSKSVEESIALFNQAYNAFSDEVKEATPPWETQIDAEVMYQSPELASIAITTYAYTGGAHGLTHIVFKNFDTTTGNSIATSDLFSDFDGFKTLAKMFFDKNLDDKNILFEPTEFNLPKNIAYNSEGIVLLYNTYEIAPYSTGIIEFVIPFKDAAPYLAFNSL